MRTLATLLVTLSPGLALACGGAPVCTVKDPTGTPLNVRESAGGRIVATVRNGTKLDFVDHVEIGGRRWARVARNEPGAVEPGWVLKAFLRCEGGKSAVSGLPTCTVRDPTGTPLNIRAEPAGEVMGSLRNGNRVTVHEERVHGGRAWVLAERLADDNAIGYVFDAYLKCEEDGGH